jgi:ATP-binding cassette subfamily B protein
VVDAVVAQMTAVGAGAAPVYGEVLQYVALEGVVIAILGAAQRGINACQALLRAQLGQVMVDHHAVTTDQKYPLGNHEGP